MVLLLFVVDKYFLLFNRRTFSKSLDAVVGCFLMLFAIRMNWRVHKKMAIWGTSVDFSHHNRWNAHAWFFTYIILNYSISSKCIPCMRVWWCFSVGSFSFEVYAAEISTRKPLKEVTNVQHNNNRIASTNFADICHRVTT